MTTEAPWIAVLREYVKAHGLKPAGKKIGYSGSAVSAALNDKYGVNGFPGNLERMQTAVEGALMGSRVDCPVVGDIPRNACIANQRRASDPRATNPMRMALSEACQKCPHATTTGVAGKERC
ncbi:XRE family transcriptional regulator [Stagnimonas aquatica]|uniref:XRE family transcriptional regulator n=1 Tax=Stagnimonas aquatica TaxID=2689987 RepID=A0A3N0V8H1_9GAMM|nr:XRE family transcriptional regulator [Stagnimonas aquatica]ROH88648.1 XRE family transcriptional regulator [Stagnimonas aquatica]